MNNSKVLITALSPLIGLPLWEAGRTVNLVWFEFGARIPVIDELGNSKVVGEYALHLQCAWRLTNSNTVLVASRDMYYPRDGDYYANFDDFDWTKPGKNYCDEQLENIFTTYKDNLIVDKINADKFGGFALYFQKNIKLVVFSDISLASESWRLLQPSQFSNDFVMTGRGVET